MRYRQLGSSDLEVSELRRALKGARPLHRIATDLSRDMDEVEAKIVELSSTKYKIRTTNAMHAVAAADSDAVAAADSDKDGHDR